MLPGEDPVAFHDVPSEELLRRWVNLQISRFIDANPSQALVSVGFFVSNFGADLSDSVALAIILAQVDHHGPIMA